MVILYIQLELDSRPRVGIKDVRLILIVPIKKLGLIFFFFKKFYSYSQVFQQTIVVHFSELQEVLKSFSTSCSLCHNPIHGSSKVWCCYNNFFRKSSNAITVIIFRNQNSSTEWRHSRQIKLYENKFWS